MTTRGDYIRAKLEEFIKDQGDYSTILDKESAATIINDDTRLITNLVVKTKEGSYYLAHAEGAKPSIDNSKIPKPQVTCSCINKKDIKKALRNPGEPR